MANASPTFFNGEADSFFDPNFTFDINQKMRVPKSIRVSGDYTNEEVIGINGSTWNVSNKKIDMNVPDRIIVAGQEQHIGTKAPPREMQLENAVLPNIEPTTVRCITPPRVLTLDTHYFPTADEDKHNISTTSEENGIKPIDTLNETHTIIKQNRDPAPAHAALDVTLTDEESQFLRRQISKLNRRVMAVESEMQQQQQKLKLMYVTAAMYICIKAMFWFGKN